MDLIKEAEPYQYVLGEDLVFKTINIFGPCYLMDTLFQGIHDSWQIIFLDFLVEMVLPTAHLILSNTISRDRNEKVVLAISPGVRKRTNSIPLFSCPLYPALSLCDGVTT